jgi:hypothetical protein
MNIYIKKYIKYKKKYLEFKKKLNKNLETDLFNLDNIIILDKSFTITQIETLHCMIKNYFENTFLPSIKNFTRPLSKSYGDVVERKLGRFEMIPPKYIHKQIYDILNESENFRLYNNLAKNEIIKLTGEDVIEELCILPIQQGMGISDGDFHRDIFVKSPNDFTSSPFYITHLIYLDNISSTEFCIDSQNNPDNNTDIYSKYISQPESGIMILFDGRIIHRGMGNKSNTNRYAIYISYYKKSYVDDESILPYLIEKIE